MVLNCRGANGYMPPDLLRAERQQGGSSDGSAKLHSLLGRACENAAPGGRPLMYKPLELSQGRLLTFGTGFTGGKTLLHYDFDALQAYAAVSAIFPRVSMIFLRKVLLLQLSLGLVLVGLVYVGMRWPIGEEWGGEGTGLRGLRGGGRRDLGRRWDREVIEARAAANPEQGAHGPLRGRHPRFPGGDAVVHRGRARASGGGGGLAPR